MFMLEPSSDQKLTKMGCGTSRCEHSSIVSRTCPVCPLAKQWQAAGGQDKRQRANENSLQISSSRLTQVGAWFQHISNIAMGVGADGIDDAEPEAASSVVHCTRV